MCVVDGDGRLANRPRSSPRWRSCGPTAGQRLQFPSCVFGTSPPCRSSSRWLSAESRSCPWWRNSPNRLDVVDQLLFRPVRPSAAAVLMKLEQRPRWARFDANISGLRRQNDGDQQLVDGVVFQFPSRASGIAFLRRAKNSGMMAVFIKAMVVSYHERRNPYRRVSFRHPRSARHRSLSPEGFRWLNPRAAVAANLVDRRARCISSAPWPGDGLHGPRRVPALGTCSSAS